MAEKPTKKILVADDSKDLSEVMRDMLVFKGYDVLMAHNSKDTVATALKEHPDLILLDLRMPDKSGFEIAREIRGDDWGKHAKILILTAVEGIGDIPPDIGIGADDYMVKSVWGIENVEKKIRQKLDE